MKRAGVAALLSVLLISSLLGALLVNLTAANPMLLSLKVNIISPQPETYNQNVILVAFTYYAPKEIDVPVNSLPNHYYYDLDEQKEVPFTPIFIDGSYCTYFPFGNGVHTLTIHVTAWRQGELIHYWGHSTVTFTVDATPRVEVISPRDKSYAQLHFLVDQPVSRAAYSLDGQANVTVELSTTLIEEVVGSKALSRVAFEGSKLLTGLALGEHNVTVYAWGETGNVSASETVVFSVGDALQTTPSPSPSSSSSPTPSPIPNSEPETEQPTPTTPAPSPAPQEPALSQETEQLAPFPTTLVAALFLVSTVAVGAGLLLYFKKRKH